MYGNIYIIRGFEITAVYNAQTKTRTALMQLYLAVTILFYIMTDLFRFGNFGVLFCCGVMSVAGEVTHVEGRKRNSSI